MRRRPRPRSRSDALILLASLVAATCFAARADRTFLDEIPRPEPGSFEGRSVERPSWVWSLQWPIRRVVHDGVYLLGALTIGGAMMVCRSRRTKLRLALRQPGAAGLVIAAIVGIGGVINVPAAVAVMTPADSFMIYDVIKFLVPSAVLGAWAVLLASGHGFRAATDGRERLGRVIGVCWLSLLAEPVASLLLWG